MYYNVLKANYIHSLCLPPQTGHSCLFHQSYRHDSEVRNEDISALKSLLQTELISYRQNNKRTENYTNLRKPSRSQCLTVEILYRMPGKAIKTLNGLGTTSPCFVKYSWSGIMTTCYRGMIFSCLKLSLNSVWPSLLPLTLIYRWDCSYRLYVWTWD